MYLWNTKSLAQDLKEGKITEKESFKYLFASNIIFCLCMLLPHEGSYVAKGMTLFFVILIVTLSYCINSRGNNTDFIKRSICISIPITIKFFILTILLMVIAVPVQMLAMNISLEELAHSEPELFEVSTIIVLCITYLLMTWRYVVHFKNMQQD